MTDFKTDFIKAKKHHDSMGTAISKGDAKGAASAAGHVMKALHGKATATAAISADNPSPVGDDDMIVQRGFGPGLQFGKGSGQPGTPKPNATSQGPSKKASSSIRARLSKFGKK